MQINQCVITVCFEYFSLYHEMIDWKSAIMASFRPNYMHPNSIGSNDTKFQTNQQFQASSIVPMHFIDIQGPFLSFQKATLGKQTCRV